MPAFIEELAKPTNLSITVLDITGTGVSATLIVYSTPFQAATDGIELPDTVRQASKEDWRRRELARSS